MNFAILLVTESWNCLNCLFLVCTVCLNAGMKPNDRHDMLGTREQASSNWAEWHDQPRCATGGFVWFWVVCVCACVWESVWGEQNWFDPVLCCRGMELGGRVETFLGWKIFKSREGVVVDTSFFFFWIRWVTVKGQCSGRGSPRNDKETTKQGFLSASRPYGHPYCEYFQGVGSVHDNDDNEDGRETHTGRSAFRQAA